MFRNWICCSPATLRVALIWGFALFVASSAFAQTGAVRCPAVGTLLSYSDGGATESLGAAGDSVCRFKNRKTGATYERVLGSFTPTIPNIGKVRSLIPLEVGKKVTYESSGAGNLGRADGAWQYTLSVERYEQLTTPAGTMATFVLFVEERTFRGDGKWERRYWYAPDVGHVVKFDFKTIQGNPPVPYPSNWMLTEIKVPAHP